MSCSRNGAAAALTAALLITGCEESPLETNELQDESLAAGLATSRHVEGHIRHKRACNPRRQSFTLDIDNDFFPLPVGRQWVLEGIEEDDEGEEVSIRVEITVLDETEIVDGVTTRVVEEREFEDGEEVEVSRNFFAQSDDGIVCYFGEEETPPSPGEWRADNPRSRAGIFMPREPEVGMVFQQEDAPNAKDRAQVVGEDETVTVPFGTFDETLLVVDCNPFETACKDSHEGDLKVYVDGLGIIVDGPAELIAFTPGAELPDEDDEDDEDDEED